MPLAGSDLELARRLDWRFLLPTAELGRVVCLGPVEPALASALARFADSVEDDSVDDEEHAQAAGADLAVVSRPDRGLISRAAAALRPGGFAYVETSGRRRRGVEAALRREGFESLRAHWHWPGFDRCAEIVPLDEPGAVRLSLARRRARSVSRLKARAAKAVHAAGILDRVVPCASIVARRPGGDGTGASFIGSFVSQQAARLGLSPDTADGCSGLLLTPAFETSRHVVVLVLPRGAGAPALVAKVPRLRDDRATVAAEADALRRLEAYRPGLTTVPRVVTLEDVHGRPVLLETALAGRPMNPAAVARDPEACVAAGLDWLGELPVTAPTSGEEAFERLLGVPLARHAVEAGAEGRQLAERTLAIVEPLRGAGLPLVFEHGDLGHPNLVLRDDGALAVLDWELAEPQGLPLNDLCFFLAYVASARARARTPGEHAAAFERAFLALGGWGRRLVEEAAGSGGIPPELVGPLFVATWARYVLRLPERTGREPGRVGTGSRYHDYWRRAVAHDFVPVRAGR